MSDAMRSRPAPLSSPVPSSSDGFVPPTGRPPRQQYITRESRNDDPEAYGFGPTHVEVLRVNASGQPEELVAEYESRHACASERFEPFRQYDGNRYHDYALVSRTQITTGVLDLETGQIVAEEKTSAGGFCPVEFYVPDWREIHDKEPYATVFSGEDLAERPALWWPRGDFGFVAGCGWADEELWKIQYLDLSRVSEGIIARDDRFGYVELAPDISLSQAVTLATYSRRIYLAVAKEYNIETGEQHLR